MENTLYDIRCKFVDLMNNEELSEEQVQELGKELALELQSKTGNIIAYVQNTDSLITAIKNEEERLHNLRKLAEERLEKFKYYVKTNMEALGLQKVQTELGALTIARNPLSVEIVDENAIPEEFKQQVVTIKTDKKAIADRFKETGEIVSGVNIINNKTSLRIK